MLWAPIESPIGFADLFPEASFALDCVAGEVVLSKLFAEEFALVENAVAKRQHEFAAGRMLARRAMSSLGVAPSAILRDTRGAPIWQEGYVGSISHSQGMAAAVVARRKAVRGVGLDMECRTRPFPWQALDIVIVPREKTWLCELPQHWREIAAFCMFSAKESIIKCLYSAGLPLFYFTQVTVQMDLALGHFEICELSGVPSLNTDMQGRLGWNENYVFTGAWWPEDL